MPRKDLFGNQVDEFRSALERYGVWPTTVWSVDHSDPVTRKLKEQIGDVGSSRILRAGGQSYRGVGLDPGERRRRGNVSQWQTRAGAFSQPTNDLSVYRGKITASIFSPAVAAWILNCFAPPSGTCFDPFAGGGTRAIMAAKAGLRYLGVELRAEEVEGVRERVRRAGAEASVEIVCGDARECRGIPDRSADFLITCPPYWTLEQYGGGPSDLSMFEDYGEFVRELGRVVGRTATILKPGAVSCWVVGLHRKRDGSLAPLHHDVARLHEAHGFSFFEEVVLAMKNNGAIQRVGNFDKGSRRLVRVHEYVLCFRAR